MNKKMAKSLLILTLALTVVFLFLVSHPVQAVPASLTDVPDIVEYPLPAELGQPEAIVTSEPGRVWFTVPDSDQIGLLEVEPNGSHAFAAYDLPPGSHPYDIIYDGERYIWYTAMGTNQLGRLDTEATINAIDEFPLPTGGSAPAGLDMAPDGRIWIAEMNASQLALFDPQTQQFVDEYLYKTRTEEEASLDKVVVVDDDSIIFTTPAEKQVVEFTPSRIDDPIVGPFTRNTVADPNTNVSYQPDDLVLNEKGHVWVSVPEADALALKVDLTQALWGFYKLPTEGAGPTALAHTVAGNRSIVWFVETGAGKVGQYVKTTAGLTVGTREHSLPSANSQPAGIAVDADGHVWISEPGVHKIAEWAPPYFHHVYLPNIVTD